MITRLDGELTVIAKARSYPASENPAVVRCWDEAVEANRAAVLRNQDAFDANQSACEAYRAAMPPLDGLRNIRDFIACVTYGMLVGAISELSIAKLLYAAQVASCACQRKSKKRKPKTPNSAANLPPCAPAPSAANP